MAENDKNRVHPLIRPLPLLCMASVYFFDTMPVRILSGIILPAMMVWIFTREVRKIRDKGRLSIWDQLAILVIYSQLPAMLMVALAVFGPFTPQILEKYGLMTYAEIFCITIIVATNFLPVAFLLWAWAKAKSEDGRLNLTKLPAIVGFEIAMGILAFGGIIAGIVRILGIAFCG